jgi:DNA polymerase-1
MDREREYD